MNGISKLDIKIYPVAAGGVNSCNFHIQVLIEPIQGKKLEHSGFKIELLGQIGELPSHVLAVILVCFFIKSTINGIGNTFYRNGFCCIDKLAQVSVC